MGLDMYLTKEIYIGANWEHSGVTGQIRLKKNGIPIPINLRRVSTITEEVGYWRKANQIHNWFVQNVQDGIDECQKSWVSAEQLKQLYNTCKKVYASRHDGGKLAQELLPTSSGFFFGTYDYDEYYYEQIQDTIKILKPIVKHLDDDNRVGDFYYQASW